MQQQYTLIIFLDCDGVLNTTRCLQLDYEENDNTLLFDPNDKYSPLEKRCLSNLKDLIEKTQAKIVLTTTWRNNSEMRETLLKYLEMSGIPNNTVLGDTPSLAN